MKDNALIVEYEYVEIDDMEDRLVRAFDLLLNTLDEYEEETKNTI